MSKYMVDHPELVQHYFEEHADKLNIGDEISQMQKGLSVVTTYIVMYDDKLGCKIIKIKPSLPEVDTYDY